MNIGTRKIVVDEAIAQLRIYAEGNGAVLRYYDGLPGMTNVGGTDPNRVSLEDLARTMVIGSDLRALDIPWLLEVDAEKEFAAVPVDARLEDAAPGSALFDAAMALDEVFSGHRGFGQAKKSKLLHLKRPFLFPVSDSFIRMTYTNASAGAELLGAVHSDLVNPANVRDFKLLQVRLNAEPATSAARLLGEAPTLRLLDILASLLGEAK
ncbi:hypothetical protein E1263_14605 [Kribbella antibiotica]|uniref:Uncharacterized protein n=1 Tax=Kribbella antibiotica TaxID=190195 RepID=A0A4V2YPX2_9ACTN|nr:DUF6308 family protein [Kribbella antibiotica]TDD59577.1 hypothetical protein E1263_14605 [Kribbella antibiotica]